MFMHVARLVGSAFWKHLDQRILGVLPEDLAGQVSARVSRLRAQEDPDREGCGCGVLVNRNLSRSGGAGTAEPPGPIQARGATDRRSMQTDSGVPLVRAKASKSRFIAVRVRGARLERGGRAILREVSWSIRPGQRWVLVGANGAGKTQLLKLVAGSVWPTPDRPGVREYVWRGERWRTPQEVREEIAYLGPELQDKYARYGWNHTVEQVVATGVHRSDIPLRQIDERERRHVVRMLRRLRIESLATRRFLTLSYGERRLALIARALASRPKLLLLDELLSGLDEQNRARALRWLESTAGTALPWVLATHRAEEVPSSATHALILERGRVLYSGPRRRAPLVRRLREGARRAAAGPSARAPAMADRPPGRVLVRLTDASVYLDEHAALHEVTITIRAGECWVVHGHNGSGKTTLLRTLYGDHGVAAQGRIERDGICTGVPLHTFQRRVGLVAPHLQTDHPRYLTVAEVVQSGRHASIGLNEAPSAADRAAARRAMREFDLLALATRTLRELSYGQLRRALFARAWVRRPALLVLDEPFAGLDVSTHEDLRARVERLASDGVAVVMTAHRRSEWPHCATHELELAGGKMRYVGPVRLSRASSRSRRPTRPAR